MYYSYDQFMTDIDVIADSVDAKRLKYILAPVRGGLIPATVLSHRLESMYPYQRFEVVPFHWSKSHRELNLSERQRVVLRINELYPGSCLIIDDIIDSGELLCEFLTHFKCVREQIAVASLIYNESQNNVVPDYFGTLINRNEEPRWVTFWWESKRKGKKEWLHM